VRGAAIAGVVGHEYLAAPDGRAARHARVRPVARPVETDADHRLVAAQPVLGHAGGDVGVMVLDRNQIEI
jgi:hypothetical protein